MTMSVPERESSTLGGQQPLVRSRPGRWPDKWGFRLVMVYLLFEFGRPQDLNPALGLLRPSVVTLALVAAALVSSGRVMAAIRQTRAFQILLLWMALHVPLAVNNYHAFWDTVAMAQTFVIYLAIVTFVDSEQK
jgi:hypothetical protein